MNEQLGFVTSGIKIMSRMKRKEVDLLLNESPLVVATGLLVGE